MTTTLWELCVFKAEKNVRLGLSFHAEADRPTISRVEPDCAAACSGLEIGDVLLAINGEPVSSALGAAAALRAREGSIALSVLRTAIEYDPDDQAATCIQKIWRGYDQRMAKLFWDYTATKVQAAWRGTITRWNVADWLNWHAIVLIQSHWRGRSARRQTGSLIESARKNKKSTKADRKQVNMVRRALSFNRKPRKRGADGGEFTALLEGSPEDREARLLARRQQTARTIEKAMHALEQEQPQPPSEAEMADPVLMAAYMEALNVHAQRQQEVLRLHEGEVRENQWISEQLRKVEADKQKEAAAQAEWRRQKEVAAQRGVVGLTPLDVEADGGAVTPPRLRKPLSPLNGPTVPKKVGAGEESGSPKSVVHTPAAEAAPTTPARAQPGEVTPAKYSQRVNRARQANRLRAELAHPASPAIHPAACAASPRC